MKENEIREGDIVEIDYIEKFTKEHINEGKALVIWKGFNHQPLVRKLNTKVTIWTCYEHIAMVVDHIDLEGYMDKNLSAEPCEDCISRQAVFDINEHHHGQMPNHVNHEIWEEIKALSPVTPQPKMGKWIDIMVGYMPAQACDKCNVFYPLAYTGGGHKFCPNCGSKMQEVEK